MLRIESTKIETVIVKHNLNKNRKVELNEITTIKKSQIYKTEKLGNK